jgi:predicted dehydrogenase
MGSIGRRHAANLLALGHEVVGLDTNPDPAYEAVPVFSGLNDFRSSKPEVVFVCTPPASHYLLAQDLIKRGIHIFIEKPITETYDEARDLNELASLYGVHLAVGYQMRFLLDGMGFLQWDRDLDIYHAQDMSTWPSAYKKDVLLEFSHEIDTAIYLNGPVMRVVARTIHGVAWNLNLHHTHARSQIRINAGEGATFKRYVRKFQSGKQDIGLTFDTPSTDFNDAAYLAEARAFLERCAGSECDHHLCSAMEAAHVLKVIAAAKESAKLCEVVNL